MKKSIIRLGFSVLIVTAMAITPANAQQDKNNNKKEQAQKQQKKQDKPDKADKVNQGKKDGKDNNGYNDDKSVGNNDKNDGFKWDRSNFKNREKIKNKEKVTLCHKFNSNDEPAVTIKVSSHALKAHLNHGDIQGDCPTVANKSFSDNFLRKRTDYFNTVQTNHEQVSYSRSVLDYAVARLTSSRQQLATMQRNNMPVADIERKQAKVVELEQNVSLLETLISAAANLVVNKLQ
jgi:hypothetical protein